MRPQALLGLAASVLVLTGCAGAQSMISADRLKYPASLSPVLPDERGKPLYLGEDLEPLGEFSFTRSPIGFLYSIIRSDVDLSDNLNGEVERRRGEGIVLLSVRAETCVSSWFFPLTVLPFYPGCQNLTVSGTIVARKPAARDPARAKP